MRMLIRAKLDTEKASRLLQEGRMQDVLGPIMENLQPEAAYFYEEGDKRAMFLVFDMEDSSQIPSVVEPLFTEAGAELHLTPAMNQDDLQKGLQQAFG